MKRKFVKVAFVLAAVVLFASCNEDESTLNVDDVLLKSVICGHVDYSLVDGEGDAKNVVAENVAVRVECDVEFERPDTTFEKTATQIVYTDNNGFFTVNIPVQMGKTVACKLLTNFEKETYVQDPDDPTDYVKVTVNFKTTKNVNVTYGEKVVADLTAANSGVVSNPGFN